MLKSYIYSCCFCILFVQMQAQVRLSTPLEILNFMEASPTQYEVEQLFGDIEKRDRPVLPHGAFVEVIDGIEHTFEHKDMIGCKAEKWQLKAREMLSVENPNHTKIRKFYAKILKQEPNNAQVYTWLGESHYEEGNYEEAKEWLDKAIRLNNIDYLARWLLAEIHFKNEELDSAVRAITIAHIYNRNNPRLLIRLKEIYKEKGLNYYQNWGFDPQYDVYQEKNTVVVAGDGIWLTYGMYKAVWNFDPDYRYIKEQQATTDYLFQEEMEAAIGTYMTYSSLKQQDKRGFPSMSAFEVALDQEMVEEYTMYEILSVDRPTIANYLTEDFLERLISYIHKVRGQNYVDN
ncbi:MAG: tetratricopeptide repeat protein [Aureispira sp.]|nr:tetratricopeptide repeat protein [Aureispira sp.]